jgi:hypothetical protein
MTTDEPPSFSAPAPRIRRNRWRMRVLLAVAALSFAFYGFVHLDRSVAERLGPLAESIHHLFNRVPGEPPPLTAASRRLVKDIQALGGEPSVSVKKRGYFGTLGQVDWAYASFRGRGFDDAALARLAEAHGARIGGLSLENTGVTDEGLKHLSKFTMLRHLHVRDYEERPRPGKPAPKPKITDAGLVHLKGLDHLWTLNLDDLPITDAGLESIRGMPGLIGLYLSRTKVEGRGLAKLKSLPTLSILYLDGSSLTQDGLKALSGATGLRILSIDGVHLSSEALPLLGAIPRLERLEATGCGFIDEEVDALAKSRPGLRIVRDGVATVSVSTGR